jgi:hypothetical protein
MCVCVCVCRSAVAWTLAAVCPFPRPGGRAICRRRVVRSAGTELAQRGARVSAPESFVRACVWAAAGLIRCLPSVVCCLFFFVVVSDTKSGARVSQLLAGEVRVYIATSLSVKESNKSMGAIGTTTCGNSARHRVRKGMHVRWREYRQRQEVEKKKREARRDDACSLRGVGVEVSQDPPIDRLSTRPRQHTHILFLHPHLLSAPTSASCTHIFLLHPHLLLASTSTSTSPITKQSPLTQPFLSLSFPIGCLALPPSARLACVPATTDRPLARPPDRRPIGVEDRLSPAPPPAPCPFFTPARRSPPASRFVLPASTTINSIGRRLGLCLSPSGTSARARASQLAVSLQDPLHDAVHSNRPITCTWLVRRTPPGPIATARRGAQRHVNAAHTIVCLSH